MNLQIVEIKQKKNRSSNDLTSLISVENTRTLWQRPQFGRNARLCYDILTKLQYVKVSID